MESFFGHEYAPSPVPYSHCASSKSALGKSYEIIALNVVLTARTGPPVAAIMVDNCIYGVDFTHCVIERVFSMW